MDSLIRAGVGQGQQYSSLGTVVEEGVNYVEENGIL